MNLLVFPHGHGWADFPWQDVCFCGSAVHLRDVMRTRFSSPLSSDLSRREALRYLAFSGATLALGPLLRPSARGADGLPILNGPQPPFYRFRIGDTEAVALTDGGIASPLSAMPWWADVPNKEVAESLQSAFLPPDVIKLAFTVLLLRTGPDLVLIDSGCGGLFGPIGGKLVSSLAAVGVKPVQISAVVLSHGHADHFGGLLDGQKALTFPNARLIINRAEHAFWLQAQPDLSAVRMPDEAKRAAVTNAQTYLTALKDHWHFVEPGSKPVTGLEVIDAPGHTPGHVAVMISSQQDRLLHVADALHHQAVSFQHPDWKFVADVLPEVAQKTRRKLMEQAASERIRVFGAHLPFPALGHVRRSDGHFEYVIEPWSEV